MLLPRIRGNRRACPRPLPLTLSARLRSPRGAGAGRGRRVRPQAGRRAGTGRRAAAVHRPPARSAAPKSTSTGLARPSSTKQANEAIPKAEGTAKRTVAEAEGYATERVNRARGDAAAFNAVLAEYKHAPEVTRTRLYLEALDKVLPKIGSVVVVQDGQANPLPLLNLRDAQRLPQKQEATR